MNYGIIHRCISFYCYTFTYVIIDNIGPWSIAFTYIFPLMPSIHILSVTKILQNLVIKSPIKLLRSKALIF
jgi:hypothetical protein